MGGGAATPRGSRMCPPPSTPPYPGHGSQAGPSFHPAVLPGPLLQLCPGPEWTCSGEQKRFPSGQSKILFLNSFLETVSVPETRNGLCPTLILVPGAEMPWGSPERPSSGLPAPGQFLPPVCAWRQAPITGLFLFRQSLSCAAPVVVSRPPFPWDPQSQMRTPGG